MSSRNKIVIVLALVLLTGCTKTIYVPQTRTEYEYKERVDSLYIRDSIFVTEKQKGDTIFINKYKERIREKVVMRNDTIIKTDSISYPVEVTKTEYKMSRFQSFFFAVGIAALVILIAWAVIKIRAFIKRIP